MQKTISSKILLLFYALCSVAGAVLPWYYNAKQIAMPEGFTIEGLWAACYANAYTASIASDLLIGSIAVMTWMMIEGVRLKMRYLWIYVVLALTVSFAFSCPLFLFFREMKLQAQKSLS